VQWVHYRQVFLIVKQIVLMFAVYQSQLVQSVHYRQVFLIVK
jgi:hypothetical protein